MLRKENDRLQSIIVSNNLEGVARPKRAKNKITPTVRIACWTNQIGMDVRTSKCLCCKIQDITQLTFECGHIIAESDGGTLAIDNLMPICHKCNNSMGTMNMKEFMVQHGF